MVEQIKARCDSNLFNKWGATNDPKDLTVGKEYDVDFVLIHGSYTQVYLVGDNRAYNSVNFSFFNKEGNEIDLIEYFNHQLGIHKCWPRK